MLYCNYRLKAEWEFAVEFDIGEELADAYVEGNFDKCLNVGRYLMEGL